jgi:protein TonB
VLVDVVVLSGDLDLYHATRDAVGERNPVWRARTAAEAADLLLTGRCGVLLIDTAAVSTKPASLIAQIVDQFPDVVVVVAGQREDEARLGQLISDGLVYRFMHKPLSPKRAGMFLGAAMRSHAERRDTQARLRLLPRVGRLRRRLDPHQWLFVGGGLVLFLVLLGAALLARHEAGERAAREPAAAVSRPPPQSAAPRSDPVLAAARAARSAGRYEAPPGRNALDLYAAVLLARPDHPEARSGLAEVTAQLVSRGRAAAAAGDAAEARRLALRVLGADAGHRGAQRLLARLDAPRAPPPAPAVPAVRATAPSPSAAAGRAGGPAAAAADRTPGNGPATAAARPRTPSSLVPPDPLTPRVVGRSAPARPVSRASGSRSYGAPVASGHPVAGYATPAATIAAAGPDDATATGAPGVAGVESRDLVPLATPGPDYPAPALRGQVEGWVEVEYTVDERGTTRDIVVVDAAPRGVFDEAAASAVAGWRYLPRVVNGRAVPQRSSVTLRFSVER